jgi:hypothetical protein
MPTTPETIFKRSTAAPTAPAPGASFLPLYREQFEPVLAHRAGGMGVVLDLLEARCRTLARPALIVEAGCATRIGDWPGIGQSTLLWRAFSVFHPCQIHSVDADPAVAGVIRAACGDTVQAHSAEPAAWLEQMADAENPPQIDLLYLDSFDFDPAHPFPTARRHARELISAQACLREGSIVAINDHFNEIGAGTKRPVGRGHLALQWFHALKVPCVYPGQQLVWQF